MPVYRVEKLYGDEALSAESVEEENPSKAAERIAGRSVSHRALQPYWYRVVDLRTGAIYEFSVVESGEARGFAK